MALHPQFPASPYAPLVPEQRWFPADEALRSTAYEKLLPPLVAKVRQEVFAWRKGGYAGASPTSVALLRYWFETDHLTENADGSLSTFRYYFAQREAVETVIWLYEVRGARDKYDLLRFDASGSVSSGMFVEDWPRYVLKMATGAGKTKVLSLLIAWSFFHKLYEADSALSRNFLVIAPNIIVLDRLRADFDGLKIFFNDPVLPPNGSDGRNWRDDFQLTLHIQDDVRIVRETGNFFLTNIHRVFLGEVRDPSLEDEDLRDYFLSDAFGKKPAGKTTDSKTDLGEIVREIEELAVFNDEAHHIHDPRMAWFKSIQDIHHKMLQKDRRLVLQVDVTATPRHDTGAIFVQTVSDYPLVEAIHQNVVKHPILPDAVSRAKLTERKSAIFTEKYDDYLKLGIEEWKKSEAEHKTLGKKAVLFVMVDDTRNCDDVGAYLEKICPELQGAVLVIHTKNNGEISEAASGKNKEELEKLRKEANEIDTFKSPHKAIVSVLMLKEGWDVRNVTTIVGLRAYAAKSDILPEQTLGRGLRRMYFGIDVVRETVPVMGTPAFMDFVESKILYDSFKSAINALTVQETGTTRIENRIRLKETRPFRTEYRAHFAATKSIFNKVVGEPNSGGFELRFAAFLEEAGDVQAFAKNYLAVGFKLDYVKANGNLSNYTPDFIIRTRDGKIWIVETKGRTELDLPQKMARLKQWCADATAAEENGQQYDFVFADQNGFETHSPKTFASLAASFMEYRA